MVYATNRGKSYSTLKPVDAVRASRGVIEADLAHHFMVEAQSQGVEQYKRVLLHSRVPIEGLVVSASSSAERRWG